ncbi:MAG: hypothetical protein JST92_17655 [Deltaproteobacteria bacterium]|nr:hypothetical protein [Deltaproteobacteria bacterium]
MAKTVREHATDLGMKAVSKLLEDPKRAEAFGKAMGGLMQAKEAFEEAQERARKAAGLVTREDFKAAGKRLSALKRRVRDLANELDEVLQDEKK